MKIFIEINYKILYQIVTKTKFGIVKRCFFIILLFVSSCFVSSCRVS